MTSGAGRPGRLRILAVLQGGAEGGGGAHQSVNALITLAEVTDDRYDVSVLDIGGSHREAIARAVEDDRLPVLPVIDAPPVPNGLRGWLKRSKSFVARATRTLLQTGDRKDDLAEFIDQQPVDLVYFLHPSELAGRLRRKNLITTVWDLCHRDFPEFPEVRAGGEFESRESILRSHVTRAVAVVVDSEESARRMERSYGVDAERLIVLPFLPSPALSSSAARETDEVLAEHALEAGYLFYPAQFWPHKNHVRLLEAVAIRRMMGQHERIVFAGADKGNLQHVMTVAERLGIAPSVHVLGYVDDLDLRGLYLGAKAVVMPTYFGPTNLPPLEAWATGRPLIYPKHLGAQVGAAGLLFDVDDADSLARCIASLEDRDLSESLRELGRQALEKWLDEAHARSVAFASALGRYDARRSTFRAKPHD
jgi:glycosyltransferase involved in cell wall biosynthesis